VATVTAPTAPSGTGNTYSYGSSTTPADRAFGSLQSGALIPQFGFGFTNTSGGTITSLAISYTGETYRLGGPATGAQPRGAADRLDFQYSTDATSLTMGTFVDENSLDYVGPVNTVTTSTGFDGNDPANRSQISGTITGLMIAPGATFYIRFVDFNAAGADDGLAIDDFSITATAATSCNAAFSFSGSPFCQSGTNPTPTVTGTMGGTFSAPTGLSINATTGAINLSASTPGTFTVTYTVSSSCSSTQSVTVTAAPTAGFSFASTSNFCTSNTGTVTPTLATGATAGTFSSTAGLTINATTGAITPSTSTPGTFTVTNTVPASGGCAATSATTTVTINQQTTAAFSFSGSSFCQSGTNPTPTITGTMGGTFSSTAGLSINATTGAIDLSASMPGTYTVTYSVGGPCPSSSTQSVTITAAPTAGFSFASTSNFCTSNTGTVTPTLDLHARHLHRDQHGARFGRLCRYLGHHYRHHQRRAHGHADGRWADHVLPGRQRDAHGSGRHGQHLPVLQRRHQPGPGLGYEHVHGYYRRFFHRSGDQRCGLHGHFPGHHGYREPGHDGYLLIQRFDVLPERHEPHAYHHGHDGRHVQLDHGPEHQRHHRRH
jgi:hypothetical protein